GRPERPPVQQKTSLLLHPAAAGRVGTVTTAAVPAIRPRASRTKMSFFMDTPRVRVENVLALYRKALVSPCEVFTWGSPANAVFLAVLHPVACLPMPVMVPAPENERARAARNNITVAVGRRHRVVVAPVAHQRQRGDPRHQLPAGAVRRRKRLRKGRQI